MILVTGGTGFIGRVLVRHLVEANYPVRILLRSSQHSPNIPRSVPVEVSVCSLRDARGLRAAMRGVDLVYHLAGSENSGGRADLDIVDIEGTHNLVDAAADARIQRFFYVSHLDANREAGYPILKAKGIAEEYIRESRVPFTILRSSVVYGLHDHFTTGLALLLTIAPVFLPVPGQGKTLVQPLWVEDLVTCLIWALDEPETINQVFEIGGGEYLSLHQALDLVMDEIGKRRYLVSWPTPYLRILTILFEFMFPRFPISAFWLDYFAANRTCPVDSIPRLFGLMPARFSTRIEYLKHIGWRREIFKLLFTRNE